MSSIDQLLGSPTPFLIMLLMLAISCSQNDFKNVGDITFQQATDDEHFEICNEAYIEQYYVRGSSDSPSGYRGEKKALVKDFFVHYRYSASTEINGYLTIRFVVNCNGQAGRFRAEGMDFNYHPMEFSSQLIGQLKEAVGKLNGWIPRQRNGKNLDFYQYLTFRIEAGKIVKILP